MDNAAKKDAAETENRKRAGSEAETSRLKKKAEEEATKRETEEESRTRKAAVEASAGDGKAAKIEVDLHDIDAPKSDLKAPGS